MNVTPPVLHLLPGELDIYKANVLALHEVAGVQVRGAWSPERGVCGGGGPFGGLSLPKPGRGGGCKYQPKLNQNQRKRGECRQRR